MRAVVDFDKRVISNGIGRVRGRKDGEECSRSSGVLISVVPCGYIAEVSILQSNESLPYVSILISVTTKSVSKSRVRGV